MTLERETPLPRTPVRSTRVLPLVLACLLGCLPPPSAGAGTEAELVPAIETALAAPALRHAITAVVVESLRDGRSLCAIAPDVALMPASNLKLVTAVAALEHLGPDYRFRSLLGARGRLARGTLDGDLFLKGFGDPTLSTAALHDLVNAVRARGIRRVTGDLVVDATFFAAPRIGRGWAWDYLQDYYAMEVSALSLDHNVATLTVRPSPEVGRPALLSWIPQTRYFSVRNETVTAAAGATETLSHQRLPGGNLVIVRGAIAADSQPVTLEGITMEDPARYCGTVLAQLLEEAGVRVEGEVRHGTLPTVHQVLHERRSPPLAEILPPFLKPSSNHIGEQVIHTVVAELTARRGSGEGEAPSVESVARDLVRQAGGDPDSIRAVDGSGLSRLNLVTPRALVQLLRYARNRPYAEVFAAALPVAGRDGTLARRMRGAAPEGNARAKTGTLTAASCLSGYVTSAAGEPLVFSIMLNNHLASPLQVRAVQDRICTLLAELR